MQAAFPEFSRLLVCGFNAGGQFDPSPESSTWTAAPADGRAHPVDIARENVEEEECIYDFRAIALGRSFRPLYAGWAQTIVQIDNRLQIFGATEPISTGDLSRHGDILSEHPGPIGQCVYLRRVGHFLRNGLEFGSLWGSATVEGALNRNNGTVYVLATPDLQRPRHGDSGSPFKLLGLQPLCNDSDRRIERIAIAHSGEVAVVLDKNVAAARFPDAEPTAERGSADNDTTTILSFASYEGFTNWILGSLDRTLQIFRIPGEVLQLQAGATSFALLTNSGQIYTWGAPRYVSILGRAVSEDSPATQPSLITELDGFHVKELAMGDGWLCGAIAEGGQLFLWGGAAGSEGIVQKLRIEDGEEISDDLVSMCMLPDWKRVTSVGVGLEHVAVTADGKLFVAGKGTYGQLGMGEKAATRAEAVGWTEVDSESCKGRYINKVWCTRWNTFVSLGSEIRTAPLVLKPPVGFGSGSGAPQRFDSPA